MLNKLKTSYGKFESFLEVLYEQLIPASIAFCFTAGMMSGELSREIFILPSLLLICLSLVLLAVKLTDWFFRRIITIPNRKNTITLRGW